MKKGDVILRVFVPTDQDAPKTVQPSASAFHHPAARLESGLFLDGLRLFATTADVGGEAELLQGISHLIVGAAPVSSTGQALVQAHTLGLVRTGLRPGRRQTLQRGPEQFHVMAVGPVHRQTRRHSLGLGQQAAFDAAFAPVCGIETRFFPSPGALWSWPRPYSPNSSPTRHNSRNTPASTHS